jgi:hypothetical protein
VTMPGLPMFGHGQIEGFTEKYGMEFSRAQWNETPDEDLIRRHEAEIFPLMRMRNLFSGAENFVLYDFYHDSGAVNENVFAYSNRKDQDRALVIFHNKYEDTQGWVRTSAAISVEDGQGGRKVIHKTIAEGLGIDSGDGKFMIFRDRKTGQEYLYRNNEIVEQGLFLRLHAYQYYVFTDFREVQDDAEGRYSRLCDKLKGKGVFSIDEAYRELRYEPIMKAFGDYVNKETVRTLFEAKNAEVAAEEFAERSRLFLKQAMIFGAATGELEHVVKNLEETIAVVLALREFRGFKTNRQSKETQIAFDSVLSMIPETKEGDQTFWRVLIGWSSVCALGRLHSDENFHIWSAKWFDEWLLTKKLAETFMELGASAEMVWREVDLVRALLSQQTLGGRLSGIKKHAQIASMLDDSSVQKVIGVHFYQGVHYFHKESFEEFMNWLFLVNSIHAIVNSPESHSGRLRRLLQNHKTFRNVDVLAVVSEYKTEKFKTLLGYAVGSESKKVTLEKGKRKEATLE